MKHLKKGKKRYDDDDGRTIARMNVDGMPWYIPGSERRAPVEGDSTDTGEELRGVNRWAYIWGILKAVFLVMTCFAVVYLLFILFCTNIWFT